MNDIEAAKLLTVSAALTGREPSEEQADVWAVVLDDIGYEEALAALREHYRVSRFPLMPADIVDHVNQLRASSDLDQRRAASVQRRRAENASHRRQLQDDGRMLSDDDVLWIGVGWDGDDQPTDSLRTNVPASIIASRSA